MTLRANFDPPQNRPEKRKTARKTLRLTVSQRRADGQADAVLVHDLSAEGMLIESAENLAVGETLALEMPRSGSHDAVVVWSSGNFYGCRFEVSLPPGALSAALLKALPAASVEQPRPAAAEAPFSERLAAVRTARGWSMEQLAGRLGVSRQSVWYWESGHRQPKRAMLARIAQELGVNQNELLERAPEGEPADLHSWKKRIARQFGVATEKVRIMIEL